MQRVVPSSLKSAGIRFLTTYGTSLAASKPAPNPQQQAKAAAASPSLLRRGPSKLDQSAGMRFLTTSASKPTCGPTGCFASFTQVHYGIVSRLRRWYLKPYNVPMDDIAVTEGEALKLGGGFFYFAAEANSRSIEAMVERDVKRYANEVDAYVRILATLESKKPEE